VVPATPIEFAEFRSQRFIVVALVYPILEEIVFRGLLQGILLKQPWGRNSRFGITSANIVASVLFTALHVIRRAGAMSAAVFLPSLIFGYFRDRYGNLYAPIALHVFYNAGFVLLFA
jgi:membrane protease YdiL (CAAX protease family)